MEQKNRFNGRGGSVVLSVVLYFLVWSYMHETRIYLFLFELGNALLATSQKPRFLLTSRLEATCKTFIQASEASNIEASRRRGR